MSYDDDIQAIRKIVSGARIALLTTVTATGELHSRPLATQEVEFDGDLWFFTEDPSSKVDDIHSDQQVNAAFQSGSDYLSVAGTAEIVHDRQKIDELWNRYAEAWFENGKDDPQVALIKVHATTAEIWSSDQPRAVQLLKVAKGVVTGSRPDLGESRTVEL